MKYVTDTLKNAGRLISNRRYSLYVAEKPDLWTPDKTVISPYKKMEVPKMNVVDYTLQKSLERWPEKTAVVCGITNRSYTYHQLYKYSRNFAVQLRSKLNIRSGDEVFIIMPNSIDYPVTVLGALQAGAEVTTINPCYTFHEVLQAILSTNPKTVICTKENFRTIGMALQYAKREVPIITVDDIPVGLPSGIISYQELIVDTNLDYSILKDINRTGEHVAFLPFSSGTTGMPRQVELTNTNIIVTSMNQDIDEVKQYRETTSTHQDAILAVLPFFHIYGLGVLLLHKLSVGAKLVVLPKFHPTSFLASMKEHKISVLYVVPPTVLFLGSNPGVKIEHLEFVQNLVWGAAPVSQNELKKCHEKCRSDLKVSQLYGSTETQLVTESEPGANNAGYAVRNTEMRIINDNGNNLGPNEIGELLVRGPQVIRRYRNNPEVTKAAFIEGNWFKTGDLASINLDGSLNVVDRIKELIKVKGYPVSPVEIENVLKDHPSILDAAVVGIADSKTGEAPKAFVVFKDGHIASDDNIKEFVAKRVADYKRLKEVAVLNELPKSPSGKILRKDLKVKYF